MDMRDLEESIEFGATLQRLHDKMVEAVSHPDPATANWYADLLLMKLVEVLAQGHIHGKQIQGIVDVWAKGAKARRL